MEIEGCQLRIIRTVTNRSQPFIRGCRSGLVSSQIDLHPIKQSPVVFHVARPQFCICSILKPREISVEKPVVEEPAPTMSSALLNTIFEMESHLKVLKKQVESRQEEIQQDEVDRMKYILEELQDVLGEYG